MTISATIKSGVGGRSLILPSWLSDHPIVFSTLALLAAALTVQAHLGIHSDDLWLILACERVFDGQLAYADFLELSPPPALFVNMPAVLLERLAGVPRAWAFHGYVSFIALAMLAQCRALLASARVEYSVGPAAAVGCVAIVLLAPDYAFGQRDHIALMLLIPLLLLCGLRAQGQAPSRGAALLAGLAAGLACSIRPTYGLSVLLALGASGLQAGVAAFARRAEIWAAPATGALVAAASVLAFPAYFRDSLPLVVDVYGAYRHSPGFLFAEPEVADWLLAVIGMFFIARNRALNPQALPFALASLGGLASYFLQGKGFGYHGLLALAFMAIAILLSARGTAPRALSVGAIGLGLAAGWQVGSFPGQTPLWLMLCVLILVVIVTAMRSRASFAGEAAALFLGATALSLFAADMRTDWRAQAMFQAEIEELGPGKTLAGITDIAQNVLPLVDRLDDRWGGSAISQWVSGYGAKTEAKFAGDPDRRARLRAYEAQDRDRFLNDAVRAPPDAIVVDRTFADAHFSDPRVEALLAAYFKQDSRTVAGEGGPQVFELYIKGAPLLRETLP